MQIYMYIIDFSSLRLSYFPRHPWFCSFPKLAWNHHVASGMTPNIVQGRLYAHAQPEANLSPAVCQAHEFERRSAGGKKPWPHCRWWLIIQESRTRFRTRKVWSFYEGCCAHRIWEKKYVLEAVSKKLTLCLLNWKSMGSIFPWTQLPLPKPP